MHSDAKLRRKDKTVYHDNKINKSNVSGPTMADMSKNLKSKYPPIRSRLGTAGVVVVVVVRWSMTGGFVGGNGDVESSERSWRRRRRRGSWLFSSAPKK